MIDKITMINAITRNGSEKTLSEPTRPYTSVHVYTATLKRIQKLYREECVDNPDLLQRDFIDMLLLDAIVIAESG